MGQLIVLLGKEDALSLCRLYGGQRIPSLRRLAAYARREMVVAGWMKGHRLSDLALKYRLSLAGNRVWPRILEKAGLPALRIQDLRHSYASQLIGQGESLAYVKDQMGHHSRVTVDTYLVNDDLLGSTPFPTVARCTKHGACHRRFSVASPGHLAQPA